MITSKSLHHTNITMLFDERGFSLPENHELVGLYRGEEAKGVRLTDNPVMHAKVITFPAIQTRLTLEGSRLRIDDESGADLEKARIASDARHTYDALFKKYPLTAWGINMDMYFRTQNLIPIRDLFSSYFEDEALNGADLLDTGIQFTLRRKKYTEIWFVKVTAPLEVAVHVNRHFTNVDFPSKKDLQNELEKCYNETSEMMERFTFA